MDERPRGRIGATRRDGIVKSAMQETDSLEWEDVADSRARSSLPTVRTENVRRRSMTAYIQVTTATETKTDAQAIADALVEKRLAACVQIIGPITSTYRWQGEIERAEEWLCVIKSRRDLYDDLEAAILEIHPYDVPEILITPVTGGSESYLEWLDDELRRS